MTLPPLLPREATSATLRQWLDMAESTREPLLARVHLEGREALVTVGVGAGVGLEFFAVVSASQAEKVAAAIRELLNTDISQLRFDRPMGSRDFRFNLRPVMVSPFTRGASDIGQVIEGLDAPLMQIFIELVPEGGESGLERVCACRAVQVESAAELIADVVSSHVVATEVLDALESDEDEEEDEDDDAQGSEFLPLPLDELQAPMPAPTFEIEEFGAVMVAVDYFDAEANIIPWSDDVCLTLVRASFRLPDGAVVGQLGAVLFDTRDTGILDWVEHEQPQAGWASTLFDRDGQVTPRACKGWGLAPDDNGLEDGGVARILQVWMAPAFADARLLAHMVEAFRWTIEAWYDAPFLISIEPVGVSDTFRPQAMSEAQQAAMIRMFESLGWSRAGRWDHAYPGAGPAHYCDNHEPVYTVRRTRV